MRLAIKKELDTLYPTFHMGLLDKNIQLEEVRLVLSFENEIKTFSNRVQLFNVIIYVPIKAPVMLDDASSKVRNFLHNKRLQKRRGSGFFLIEYAGFSGDFVEEKIGALGRILEFKVPMVRM